MTLPTYPEPEDIEKFTALIKRQKSGQNMSVDDLKFVQKMACNYPAWYEKIEPTIN